MKKQEIIAYYNFMEQIREFSGLSEKRKKHKTDYKNLKKSILNKIEYILSKIESQEPIYYVLQELIYETKINPEETEKKLNLIIKNYFFEKLKENIYANSTTISNGI
jgi:hypothetical protein